MCNVLFVYTLTYGFIFLILGTLTSVPHLQLISVVNVADWLLTYKTPRESQFPLLIVLGEGNNVLLLCQKLGWGSSYLVLVYGLDSIFGSVYASTFSFLAR
ncbi:uncharacterized protein EV154DRAFT_548105 [Mucor mucedo]|uniref:uncharacterized protein n=1 Tax=Mucor mucedo TaxID=29922 RepID=UPI00221F6915|nr:uncharacterized protein EV154DRAFT_548105 [Mucor mucedo]KAI7895773.1 hypothetical protein EV154DRAFT_548105 [Mucor mucedo]